MKVIWHVGDIVAGRRVAISAGVEQWIIGYDPSIVVADKSYPARMCLVSLEDGMMATKGLKPLEMADYLNANNYLPIEVLR